MTRRRIIALGLAVGIIIGLFFFSIVNSTTVNGKRIDISERILRDVHCALVGYSGPDRVTNFGVDRRIDPKTDCGPPLPSVEAQRQVILDLEQAMGNQATEVVKAVRLRQQGVAATVVVTRTRTRVVVMCHLPNGRPCP